MEQKKRTGFLYFFFLVHFVDFRVLKNQNITIVTTT